MTGRIRFAFFLNILLFALVISKLFYWQVVKAEELSFLGNSQYGKFINLSSERGEIKTSDGFPIATNKLSFLVFANPKEVKDKKSTARILSSTLNVDLASVSASLALDRLWVPVKSRVDSKTKEEIEKLDLKGVGFEQEYVRFYPEASMGAQLIGFVGKSELGEDNGYFGLEGFYDRQLRGKSGVAVQIHDALGRPILSRINDNTSTINGRSLILSIERPIQYIAEQKLKEGVEKYGASGGMVGVMNPKTGEIIAMASFPSFDQRNYSEYSEELYKNPFVTNVFEPGSTFKALIMASALDAKVVKPETKCPVCDGPVTIGEYQIKTWNNKYYKDTNMIDIIKHSDNTGMVFVAKTLGLEKMLHYFQRFGIGEITGIDLQGEVAVEIKPIEKWYPIDLATASFGQGISLTPMELLVAFASIANEGKRMEPHVVSQIQTPDGQIIPITPKILNQTVSPETAKVMTEMLVNAVDGGEAKWIKPKGYRVAGKTGTAQIPIAGHYDASKTIASFVGFAPADDPKFVMLVIIDRPTTSIYGAETAAPVFFEIAKNILTYYKILPKE